MMENVAIAINKKRILSSEAIKKSLDARDRRRNLVSCAVFVFIECECVLIK